MRVIRWIVWTALATFLIIIFVNVFGSKTPKVDAQANITYEYAFVAGDTNKKFYVTNINSNGSYGGYYATYICDDDEINRIRVQNGTAFIIYKDGSIETFCGNFSVQRVGWRSLQR